MRSLPTALLLALVFVAFACKKDEDSGPQGGGSGTTCFPLSTDRVLITNEGTFMSGNGSLSIYQPGSGSIFQDVYSCVNGGLPLGDVVQSVNADANYYYVVVNNSGKVQVLDKNTLQVVSTWTGMNSPRYVHLVNSYQAYVTDLYVNGIHVWSPANTGYVDFIPTSGWTEKMVWHQSTNQLLVTQPDPGQLLLLNTNTNVIADSMSLTLGAGEIVVDDDDHVWVLCSGGYQSEIPALYHFDENLNPVDTFAFSSINESPGSLSYFGNQLYFLNGDVFTMNVNGDHLPTSPLVAAGTRLFYSMGVSLDGSIYVSDAIDYVQDGMVYIYNQQGTNTGSFEAGIIPGGFHFD